MVGELRRVGVGLVLAGLGAGERGAGQNPEHPRGVGFHNGETRDALTAQCRGDTTGVLEKFGRTSPSLPK